jgi:hypothetical protein
LLKQGRVDLLNLGSWNPVSIKAYVGTFAPQGQQTTQGQQPNPYVNQNTVGANGLTA